MPYAKKDMEAWNKWNTDQTPENMGKLLKQTEKVRYKAIQNWTGTLAPASLNSEAVKLSVRAFKTYDPDKNVKLSTHLTTHLKKLSRMNYSEQNLARIPENRQMSYTTYHRAFSELEDHMGREPTIEELADHLSWSTAEVRRFQRESRKEFVASEPLPVFDSMKEDGNKHIYFAVADMAPTDRLIFEHTTGFNGNKIMENKGLMAKTGLNQGQLSHRKRLITKSLVDGQKKFG